MKLTKMSLPNYVSSTSRTIGEAKAPCSRETPLTSSEHIFDDVNLPNRKEQGHGRRKNQIREGL
jgi:hypothetical protein